MVGIASGGAGAKAAAVRAEHGSFAVDDAGSVSCHWLEPQRARAAVGLAHGAGNDMHHPFMVRAQALFARLGTACMRFNFPYKEAGHKAPDRAPRLEATWVAALAAMSTRHPDRPRVAAGKSMGGRMASLAVAHGAEADALVLLGYPLHAAGRPQAERAEHFPDIRVPTLFVQGSRDRLCDLARLEAVLPRLGAPAALHVVDDGDHSFNVPKRSARDEDEVWSAIERAIERFLRPLVASPRP